MSTRRSRLRAGTATGRSAPSGEATTRAVSARVAAIDAARGVAIALMIAYHFTFDLTLFGVLQADFYADPRWIAARSAIVSMFLALAGASLALAARRDDFDRRFWRRVALIAGCALLVSAGSWLVFRERFIYFGILHCIALSSVLARPLLGRAGAAALIGLGIVVAGATVSAPMFDHPALHWIGMTTVKPPTEDYAPLFPWLGVVLLGLAAGVYLRPERLQGLAAARGPVAAVLAAAGRHSLLIYLAHQPLLLGALWLALRR